MSINITHKLCALVLAIPISLSLVLDVMDRNRVSRRLAAGARCACVRSTYVRLSFGQNFMFYLDCAAGVGEDESLAT